MARFTSGANTLYNAALGVGNICAEVTDDPDIWHSDPQRGEIVSAWRALYVSDSSAAMPAGNDIVGHQSRTTRA